MLISEAAAGQFCSKHVISREWSLYTATPSNTLHQISKAEHLETLTFEHSAD